MIPYLIVIGLVFILFITTAYIAARLDDKLQEERNRVNNLLEKIAILETEIKAINKNSKFTSNRTTSKESK